MLTVVSVWIAPDLEYTDHETERDLDNILSCKLTCSAPMHLPSVRNLSALAFEHYFIVKPGAPESFIVATLDVAGPRREYQAAFGNLVRSVENRIGKIGPLHDGTR